jgi:hypothetical protein
VRLPSVHVQVRMVWMMRHLRVRLRVRHVRMLRVLLMLLLRVLCILHVTSRCAIRRMRVCVCMCVLWVRARAVHAQMHAAAADTANAANAAAAC